MDIQVLISKSFPDGLSYDDTAQLCLRLFCSVDGVPEKLHEQCNKENLAVIFSVLAKSINKTGHPKTGYMRLLNYYYSKVIFD